MKQSANRTSAARFAWLRTRSDTPERHSRRARSARCGTGTRSEQRRRAQRNPSGGSSHPVSAGAPREFTTWRSTQLLPTRTPLYPTDAWPARSMALQCSPKEPAALACVRSVLRKRAAARAPWRDTSGAGRVNYDSGRERCAPDGAVQQKGFSLNRTLGCTKQRSRDGGALCTYRATV